MLADRNVGLISCRCISCVPHPLRNGGHQMPHVVRDVLLDQQPLIVTVAGIHKSIIDMCQGNSLHSMPHALKDPGLHGAVKGMLFLYRG